MEEKLKNTIRKIQMVDISKIHPYENNPRNNDKAVPKIVESIKRYGFNVPITVDKNGIIATGHTRYKAALRLGLKEVPVIYLNDLTKEEIDAWRLVDNKTSELATWDEDKPLHNDLHPTMKPIRLLARFIANSSRKGEIVLNQFGGSGSTMMACEQTGRKCRMIELDPAYCDVIVDRWEKATGEKAELIRKGTK